MNEEKKKQNKKQVFKTNGVPFEGVTLVANIFCKSDKWLSIPYLQFAIVEIVRNMGLTPFEETMQIVQFPVIHNGTSKHSCSVALLLAESHIGVHTWIERNAIRLELSSCKKVSLDVFIQILELFFPESTIEAKSYPW